VLAIREVDQRDRHVLGALQRMLHVAPVLEPDDAPLARLRRAAGDQVGRGLLLLLPLLDEPRQAAHVAPCPSVLAEHSARRGACAARGRAYGVRSLTPTVVRFDHQTNDC
jgi:hypothetical protein